MPKIFLIAGHSLRDPGAVVPQSTESAEVRKLQDQLLKVLRGKGLQVLTDPPELNLTETIAWVRQHAVYEDVLLDLHLNAGPPTATGTEVFLRRTYSPLEMLLAQELATRTHQVLGISNRGVKLETQTRHGRLGILHTGVSTSCLLEVCFLTNPADLRSLHRNRVQLVAAWADSLAYHFLEGYHSTWHLTLQNTEIDAW